MKKPVGTKTDKKAEGQEPLAHRLTSEKSRAEFSEIRAVERILREKWARQSAYWTVGQRHLPGVHRRWHQPAAKQRRVATEFAGFECFRLFIVEYLESWSVFEAAPVDQSFEKEFGENVEQYPPKKSLIELWMTFLAIREVCWSRRWPFRE